MKTKIISLVCSLITSVCAVSSVTTASAADSPREHLLLDANWKFHLGDYWPGALRLDKAGVSPGPASEKFSDQSWRTLNLPHDWAIELPFDQNAECKYHGFKPFGPGFEKNSFGWYRRTFELPASDSGKRIWLTFDGVMHDATVWVNGWLVKRHAGGYYPFREDITDVLHFGGMNTISVRVDATEYEGQDSYEGAGIYRDVWLDKTAPVAIAPDGIFVYSTFKHNVPSKRAEIHVEATLLNTLTNEVKATVTCEIISPDGKLLRQFSVPGEVKRESQGVMKLESKVSPPVLWSPESPKLYKLIATVSVAGKVVDQATTPFGIRTVAFDPNKGFLLNGKHYEIYGTCNHQEHAGVGEGIPDALQAFRVEKLKEVGCNAIRTSHGPPTPALLDACDRLGMLVMDENRLLGSDSENLRKWGDQIRRDRNHPCVAIWSLCNEEPQVASSEGGRVGATMQRLVNQLDPTRSVTAAELAGDNYSGLMGTLEVRGWNYHAGPDMDKYHAEHPNQPNVGTEQAAVGSTRGIYANDKERGYMSAYDVADADSHNSARSWWSIFAERPWLSGGFVWAGFDYRGEPTPYSWPCINSHYGILDTCGFWKDIAWYYEAWWTTNTVLHIFPHWNWPGKEGQEIRVDAYSNCKSVELFLNGTSLGKQAMKPYSKLSWQVKYAPGTLSAKGYDANGNQIAETKVETTGDPVQVQLTPDRKAINADGEDVAVFTVSALDAQGRVVPVAQNKINFTIEGAGKILGVGNGDPSCHEPDVFIPNFPRTVAVSGWRWTLAKISGANALPEYANDFDDSTWNIVKTGGDAMTIKTENTTAIYRAHLALTDEDLNGSSVQIHFAGCKDEGWYFVNNRFVGESHDWHEQPSFDIKKFLHPGDNVIAVGVNNVGGQGGLNPNVNVDVVGKTSASPWSRSLFNGYAQIIVQATKEAGEIKLTATADNLAPATAVVQTQPCAPRPSVK